MSPACSFRFGIALFLIVANACPSGAALARQERATDSNTAARTGDGAQPLEIGKAVERELKGGETHVYAVELQAGDLFDAVVEQKGIDIVVTVFDPDGKQIQQFDSPNGAAGPEPLLLIADRGGAYRMEIASFDTKAAAGRYEAKIRERRAATQRDRDLSEAARLISKVSELYGNGKYAEALPLAERALALNETALGPDHVDVATALHTLGVLYWREALYSKAEPLLLRALAIREKALGPADLAVAASLTNLAMLYQNTGYFAKAESFYQRALIIEEKALGPSHPDVASAVSNLAVITLTLGLYAKAESLAERALAIRERAFGPDHPDVAVSLNVLAVLYEAQGRQAKAEQLERRALATWEKAFGSDHPIVAIGLANLAELYLHQGLYAKAEPLVIRALAIREKTFGPNHPKVAESLNDLATVYQGERLYAKAEPLYQRALAIDEAASGRGSGFVNVHLDSLAGLYQAEGLYAKAEPLYRRAVAINEKVRGPDHPFLAKSLNHLAVNLLATGRVFEALDAQTRANDTRERDFVHNLLGGSERDKLEYLGLSKDELNLTLSLHIRAMPSDTRACRAALEILLRRKGRALDAMTDQIATLRHSVSPDDQKLLDELEDARARLSALTFKEPEAQNVEQHLAELKAARERVESIESEVGRRSAAFRAQSATVSLDDVQKAVPAGIALVEFAAYRPVDARATGDKQYGAARYAAYVLLAKGEPRWVDLGDAAPIDQAVQQFRAALRDPKRGDMHQLGRALDEKLMRPVRALLGDTANLLISPDAALNLVPYAALVDEHDRYLAERYAISYLTSGRDLLRLQQRSTERSVPLLIADPDYQMSAASDDDRTEAGTRAVDIAQARFRALPATEVEAREVARLLPNAVVRTGARATEEVLKRAGGPRVLHIATHGFYFDEASAGSAQDRGTAESERTIKDPLLRSGLALAGANRRDGGNGEDGILTALEASGLDLWGTKLVVLSACDTGLGEVRAGEGVYGLRRALVLAGSETQMMSLWAVDDRATRELMVAYYKELLAGAGRAEAMRRVQLRMLKNPKTRHSAYWASFIVSGDWRPLER